MRKHGIATFILLQLIAVEGLAAQAPPLSPEHIRIGTATVEWYARDAAEYLRRSDATLVISQETDARAVRPEQAGDGAGVARTTSRASFGFNQPLLSTLARHAGVAVETCSRYEAGSLCNIRKPFLWVTLSVPLVENDRAVIFLRALEPFPDAPDFAKTLQSTLYQVDLVRKDGNWQVIESRVRGVS